MTLAACSNSDELTGNANGTDASSEPTAVQFSTYLAGGQTRATVGSKGAINTDKLKESGYGFGVMAFSTGNTAWANGQTATAPNFMYNQQVTFKSGSTDNWEYSPIKYWPNDFSNGSVDAGQGVEGEPNNATGSKETDGKVSFFAYAPFVDLDDYTATGTAFTTTDAPSFGGTAYAGSYVATKGATDTENDGIIALTTNATKNDPLVRYGLTSTKYSEDVDLLWGLAGKGSYNRADNSKQTKTSGTDYNTDLTKQAVNEKVAFLFKHALAKLGGNTNNNTGKTETDGNTSKVKVVLDLDNGETDASTAITGGKGDFSSEHTTLVTVKSIKIQDWASYKAANSDNPYKNVDANKYRKYGWFNIATGKWSDATDDDKVAITSDGVGSYSAEITADGGTGKYKLDADIAEPSDASSLQYDATNKWQNGSSAIDGVIPTTKKNVYALPANAGENQDEGIVMIPGGDDLQLVVTVDYVVRTYDGHLAKQDDSNTNSTWSYSEQVITNLVTIPGDAVTSNKVYSLLIHLGLTSVKFTAEVNKWEDATDNDPDDTGKDDNNGSSTANKDIYLPSNTLAAKTITDATASINDDATTATYGLSNLPTGAKIGKVTATKNGTDFTGATVTLGEITAGAATATVNGLEANTSTDDDVTYIVTFEVLNSQGTVLQNVTLTITQAKKTA